MLSRDWSSDVCSSDLIVQTTATASWAGGCLEATRLDSSWTVDDRDRMRSLSVGDSITRGGIGGLPLRYGGIRFGRNFEVQPGFVTLPMPSLNGSAALPSVDRKSTRLNSSH